MVEDKGTGAVVMVAMRRSTTLDPREAYHVKTIKALCQVCVKRPSLPLATGAREIQCSNLNEAKTFMPYVS